jgi:Rrf2 family protein
MVSKILKILAGSSLLASHRGVKGGYSLTREPEAVTLEEIVAALEGPIALTDCSDDGEGGCDREPVCNVGGHWKIINKIILDSMRGVTLAQLADPPRDEEASGAPGLPAEGCAGCAPELPVVEQPNPDSTPRV